jgi:hypothetical protein
VYGLVPGSLPDGTSPYTVKPGQVIGPVPGFCLETGLSRERGHATFSEEPLPEDDDPEDDPDDDPDDEPEDEEEPEEPEEAFEDEEPAESEELDDVLSEEAVADSDFVSAEAAAAELLLEPRLSVR